ncbi:ATP synthase F1 subunit epsilon [Breznakiellaceae bacterium SP9]
MAALFPFEVHTPYRRFYAEQVESIILTLMDGSVGILAHHTPFTAPVNTGVLKIKDKDGIWRSAFITDGILEVKQRKTILIVDAAEWPDEIDHERALLAQKRAQELLESSLLKFEIEQANANLKRAQFRLAVYELRGTGSSDEMT